MIHERDVRDKIAAVLRNEISLVDFARWIMSNSWNMHQDSARAAVDLVSNIHLLLAERDDLSINDNQFLRELAGLLNNVSDSVVVIEDPNAAHMPFIGRFAASPAFWIRPSAPLIVQLA